jgi:hypothetical protein
MATNNRWKFSPEEDEFEALRERHAKLQAEYELLKKQNKAPQERPRPSKPAAPPKRSSIFLIIAALLVAARVVLYLVVEHAGTRDTLLGYGVSAVFGFAGFCMIVAWAIDDYAVEGWITAGAAIFLVVEILISVSILDPNLLENGQPGPVQHPLPAAAVMISSLLFAATRTFRLIIGGLLLLISSPLRRGN